MDKSYIIRVYKQEKETARGIVEDIEKNKRAGFSNAKQLWNLITGNTQEHKTDNVIKPEEFNSSGNRCQSTIVSRKRGQTGVISDPFYQGSKVIPFN